ncbi:MAG: CusA/CzcA family heavy metal efflux RND transporter [Bacteroidales bacterium]|nr:CusA/CzcA family heavy metal efflux RND transporter [Bacteroidales bacterium]
MERLIRFALRRRGLVAVIFIVVSLFGFYSWTRLSIDAYPDIADVTVQVVTQVPGLAAEEVEQQITIPLERALNGIPSLDMMRSKNGFGLSIIMLVFKDGTEDYWARQRVRECIGDVDLPYGAVPELNPLTSPTGEIYRYVLLGEGKSLRELTEINKWTVIPTLQQIQGVAAVSNFGGLTTQYQLEIDPRRLASYDLSLSDVEEALENNNANAGGSMISLGDVSYVVRGVGLIRDLEDMGDIVVKNEDGIPVFLRDLGELRYGNLERKGILGYKDDEVSFSDGVEGIVQMLRYQNPSEVLERVHKAVDDLNRDGLPEGVEIRTFMDRTDLVGTTLDTVEHTLLFGMLLVIGILLIFLGSTRSALIVAATIPVSLLIAFILMHLTGIPANLLSLGAIDFGILVDGAIVMTETILKLREEDPSKPLTGQETLHRVLEVAKPIFFATLIIIMAYMPLFAFERIEKKLFTPMAFTVGYALVGALSVALLLIPGLAYAIYRKPQKVYHNKALTRMNTVYRRHTGSLLDSPKKIFAGIAAVLAAVIVMIITVGKDFLPNLDEGGIWIQVQTPPGISLERSTRMADELRDKLKGFDEVTYVMTQVGRDDEGAEAFTSSHIEVCVGLRPYSEWKWGKDKDDLIAQMADTIALMPGYRVGFSQPIIDMVMDQIAGAHSDLAMKIYGEDLMEDRRIATEVERILSGIPGATDVIIDQEPPLPQLQITADREKAAYYGVNIADIAQLVETAIGGRAVSQVYIGNRVYDVICRFREDVRDTPEKIAALTLTTASGSRIPLSAVAEVTTRLGASFISREMGKRQLTVRVNLRGKDLTTFLNEADALIRDNVEYDHVKHSLKWDGQFENQRRAYTRLALIIPFVLAIMFILLYGAFRNFRQAGLLIVLLPLALFGGLLALNVRGMTFNVSSAVGFIALFGLTIQNGVIMISHINHLRQRGTPLREAVIEGASHRLRPVLMTATVAILGLLPASLATGIGSDVQRPLATVIVYGLLFSTIITLYILPTLYYRMERRQDRKPVKQDEEVF